jgi:serine/threonine protein kinase
MIPENISSYKINRLIGEGGMAKVYEAHMDEKLGTKVAIKVLNPHLVSEEQLRLRFKQEAESMLKLKHPNITNVLSYIEEDDTFAIVMEYLEGESLSEMVARKGAIAPALAIQIYHQVLDAMQYVHEKGVIHRDIKPSNIFILEGKYPKILDFGIVKVLGGDSMTKTKTGLSIGTPMFMSPEQIQTPKDIDFRTDIYSLGVTMHYMLAGRAPYDPTESEFVIQSKVVRDPLPQLSMVPPNMVTAIVTAAQKDRNQRFQSCQDFQNALSRQAETVSHEDKTLIDNRTPEKASPPPVPLAAQPPQPAAVKKTETKKPITANQERDKEISMFFIRNNGYFQPHLMQLMKDDMMALEDTVFQRVTRHPYKNPGSMFWAAFPGGIFGIDRFMLGETGLGVLKLLFGWLSYGIWMIIDAITIKKRTQKYNHTMYMKIKTGILF